MNFRWALALVALLALGAVGCNPPKQTAQKTGDEPGVTQPSQDSEASNPSGGEATPEAGKTLPNLKLPPLNEKAWTPPPAGADGWEKANRGLLDLAKRMDNTMSTMRLANVSTVSNFEIEGQGRLTNGIANTQIKDARTFKVEYFSPRTEAKVNRVRADGAKRIELGEDGWEEIEPAAGPNTMSESDLEAWSESFTRQVFAAQIDGRPTWTPLFRALARGTGGYKTVVEEQEQKREGKTRKFYRVLAEKPDKSSTIEIRVDGVGYVPVTIRVQEVQPDGAKHRYLWRAIWSPAPDLSTESFVLPAEIKSAQVEKR